MDTSLGMHSYRTVAVKRQSFKLEKRITVPQQSMTLHEIIRRFVRREQLPVLKEGTYETRMGDLEKLAKEDISVQMERVEEIRKNIDEGTKRLKAKEDEDVKRAIEEKARKATEPVQQGEGDRAPGGVDPKQ